MAVLAGELAIEPDFASGTKGRYVVWAAVNGGAGQTTPPIHYKMAAIRTSDGVRIYWPSSSISLNDAPGGAGIYTPATLTVESSW